MAARVVPGAQLGLDFPLVGGPLPAVGDSVARIGGGIPKVGWHHSPVVGAALGGGAVQVPAAFWV
jgi:hypothetical protein